MPNLTLEDLQRRIAQQDAERHMLQQELEARRKHLATLTHRKQELQTELQHVEAEMATIATGAQRPVATPSQPASKKPIPKPSSTAKPDQPSLPALIVTMIREVGRPLTLPEMVAEAQRRGYLST